MEELKYHRILLKLSGEALGTSLRTGIDPQRAVNIAMRVREVREMGVDVAIVIGAGNLLAWASWPGAGYGSRHRRLHGHAGNRDECTGADGCL